MVVIVSPAATIWMTAGEEVDVGSGVRVSSAVTVGDMGVSVGSTILLWVALSAWTGVIAGVDSVLGSADIEETTRFSLFAWQPAKKKSVVINANALIR
jgi:hypothetical protein